MIWAGRPGLWQDWQTFQAKARKERLRKIAEAERRKKELIDAVLIKVFNKLIRLLCSSLSFVTCLSSKDDADPAACLNLSSLTSDSLVSKKFKFSNKNNSTSFGSNLLIYITFVRKACWS